MDISAAQGRHAFSVWLRTGHRPRRPSGDIELKFNPYHDPRNGRFTFAPGGPRSVSNIVVSDRYSALATSSRDSATGSSNASHLGSPNALGGMPIGVNLDDDATVALFDPPMAPGPTRTGRGSNIRAFEDPMTLEQSFPGLHHAPGGAIVAVADTLFDLTGPANAMTTEVLRNQSRQLMSQIKTIDPAWHYDEMAPTDAFGNPIYTVQGLIARVNELRFQRAAVIARAMGDYKALQVEMLRFVQRRADDAYDRGVALLKAGRLTPRLSKQEALGNYIDREVRRELRNQYNRLGIDSAGAGPVRVNRRENISSGGDLTYRRPDARVNDVAFDVTLTRKTLGTAQVRGFFDADFHPSRVVIIRPRQLGADYTYAITRPEKKP
ncbi:MAG TPA: hypothetical protein VM657_03410 [Sphingomonas sp.]|nr:hypothetical protein [Sphingomonas sp.]